MRISSLLRKCIIALLQYVVMSKKQKNQQPNSNKQFVKLYLLLCYRVLRAMMQLGNTLQKRKNDSLLVTLTLASSTVPRVLRCRLHQTVRFSKRLHLPQSLQVHLTISRSSFVHNCELTIRTKFLTKYSFGPAYPVTVYLGFLPINSQQLIGLNSKCSELKQYSIKQLRISGTKRSIQTKKYSCQLLVALRHRNQATKLDSSSSRQRELKLSKG